MKTLGFIAFILSPVALFAFLHLKPPADASPPAAGAPCRVVTARHPAGDLKVSAQVCPESPRLATAGAKRYVD